MYLPVITVWPVFKMRVPFSNVTTVSDKVWFNVKRLVHSMSSTELEYISNVLPWIDTEVKCLVSSPVLFIISSDVSSLLMVVEVPIFDVVLTLFEEAMFHGVFVSGNKESSAAVKWSLKKNMIVTWCCSLSIKMMMWSNRTTKYLHDLYS